jgi:hypothetical protein
MIFYVNLCLCSYNANLNDVVQAYMTSFRAILVFFLGVININHAQKGTTSMTLQNSPVRIHSTLIIRLQLKSTT